jgi:hypothetical protein
MEWFGPLTNTNAWARGAFEGAMLAIFVYFAQTENKYAWLAVMITIGIMIGEARVRDKMHKSAKNKDIATVRTLEKRCEELEKNANEWKARSLRLQTKMERAGVDL